MKAEHIEWHRLAYLYAHKGLELHEIVKAAFVFTTAKIIEDDNPTLGYGILNNRGLFQAMVYAMIQGYPEGQAITQADMARAMGWNRSTVSRLVKSMEKDGTLVYDRDTSTYVVNPEKQVPEWIMHFGKALIELQFDDEMKAKFDKEYENFWFMRGFQVLWAELKNLKPLGRLRPNFSDENND